MSFNVLNENYQFKNGDVITVFKLENSDKRCIVYAVDDYEKNESKILVSYLETDESGYDQIVPIEDSEQRKKIINLIKEMIKGGLK